MTDPFLALSKAWYERPPSAEWQWTALVVGVVALFLALVALPTVFQMFGGRPKVDFAFGNEPDVLKCDLGQPFVAGWLRLLSVRRTPVDVMVGFHITRLDTGETVADVPIADLVNWNNERGKTMILSPSILPSLILFIADWHPDRGVAIVRDPPQTQLTPNTYQVEVHVLYAGSDFGKARHNFVVTIDGLADKVEYFN